MKVDDKMYETDNSDNGLAIVPQVIGTQRPEAIDHFEDLPLDDIKIDGSELNFHANFSQKGAPISVAATECVHCGQALSALGSMRAMEVQTERIDEVTHDFDDSILVDVDENETPESVAHQISEAKQRRDGKELKLI